mgnify:CR=1 FL=1
MTVNQNILISALTNELPVLRARLSMSQEEIAKAIGVSRQTYGSIETKKRDMSWTVFVALIGFFQQNSRTALMLEQIPNFKEALINAFEKFDKANETNQVDI